MVRAVFFVLDCVLVTAGSRREVTRAMAVAVAAPVVEFSAAWEEMQSRREVSARGTLEDDLDDVLRRLGVFARPDQRAAAIDVLIESERAQMQSVRPGALEALAALRERRVKTALVADVTALAGRMWAESPLAPYFEAAAFSFEAGVALPDRRMFLLACERLGVEPAHSLLVARKAADLSGAVLASMRAVALRGESEEDGAEAEADEWQGPRVAGFEGLVELVDQEITS